MIYRTLIYLDLLMEYRGSIERREPPGFQDASGKKFRRGEHPLGHRVEGRVEGSHWTTSSGNVNFKFDSCQANGSNQADQPAEGNVVASATEKTPSEAQGEGSGHSAVNCLSYTNNQVLLATALVDSVSAKDNAVVVLRSFIDPGSQLSLISEAAARMLGLKRIPEMRTISGLGGDSGSTIVSKSYVSVVVRSRLDPSFTVTVKAHVLSKLTNFLPSKKVPAQVVSTLPSMELAGSIVAQNTKFGWIIFGNTHDDTEGFNHGESEMCHSVISMHVAQCNEDEQLKKFWVLESDSTLQKKKHLTSEEERCEKLFAETTSRDESGRFVVKLPFRSDDPPCKYELLQKIKMDERDSIHNLELKTDEVMKILGLTWNRDVDRFQCTVKLPSADRNVKDTALEERTQKLACHANVSDDGSTSDLMSRYSSLKKLVRVVAFCRRVLSWKRTEKRITDKILSVKELNDSLQVCIKLCQKESFAEEMDDIQKCKLKKSNRLTSLSPYLDSDGVLRVGGRIQRADVVNPIKLLLLLFGLASAQFLPNGCPEDFSVHLLLPHESDCQRYYSCSNGRKILMQCAPGTLFDVDLHGCNHAHAVDSDFSIHLLLPHETDCSNFYSCSNGRRILMNCPSTLFFDFKSQTCDWPQNVECNIQTTTEPTTDGTNTETTYEFTTTTLNELEEEIIANTTTTTAVVDKITTLALVTDGPVTASTTSESLETTSDLPSTPSICPDGFFGVIPHPELCDSYYTCTGWSPIQLFCRPGQEFDPEQEKCVEISEGGCTWSQNPVTNELTSTEATTENNTSSESTTAVPDVTEDLTTDKASIDETTQDATTPKPLTTTEKVLTEFPTTAEVTTNQSTVPDEETTFTVSTEKSTTNDSSTNTTVVSTTENWDTTLDQEDTETAEVTTERDTTQTTTEKPVPTITCPDDYFGNLPHPERCDAYFLCSGWDPILLFCPSSKEFDPASGVCVDIAEGGCTWVQTSTTAITEQTTIYTSSDNPTDVVTEEISTTSNVVTDEDFTTDNWKTTTTFKPTDELTTFEPTTGNLSTFTTTSKLPETTTETVFTTAEETSSTYEATTNSIDTTAHVTEKISTDSSNTTDVTTDQTFVTEEEYFEPTTEKSTTLDSNTTAQPEPVIVCPDGYFGNMSHPDRCDAYFLCSGWDPILLFCPSGNEFDPISSRCVIISEGGCNWQKNSTTTVTEQTTSPDMSTDAVTEEFSTTSDAVTTSWETTIPTDEPTFKTTTQELTTLEPTTTQNQTDASTIETTTEKEESTQVETEGTTAQPTPIIVCPDGYFGNMSHPDRCDAYFLCSGWDPILLFCPSGNEFDPTSGRCVTISVGGCNWQKNDTTTVTEHTTSPDTSTDAATDVFSTTSDAFTTSWETTIPTDEPTFKTTTQELTTLETTTTQNQTDASTIETTTEKEESTHVETEGTTAQPTPVICPDGYFGSVPHPERCDAYFMCTGWDPILLFCPSGNEFDPVSGTCLVIAEGGCNWQKNGTTSTTERTTAYTSPNVSTDLVTEDLSTTPDAITTESWETTTSSKSTDEQMFETTTEGLTTLESTTFNVTEASTASSNDSTTENLATISESQTTLEPTNETETSTNEIDTTEDFTTEYATSTHTIATEDQETTVTLEVTSEHTSTPTESTTVQPTPVICPDGYFGSVPHPERCDAYFMCTGWDPILLFCPSGNEFDPAAGTCVVIAEGGCNWQKNSTTSETEPTTIPFSPEISTDAVTEDLTTTPDYVTQNGSTTEFWNTTTSFESTSEAVTQNLTTTSDFVTQNGFSTEYWETTTYPESTVPQTTLEATTDEFITSEPTTLNVTEASTYEATTENLPTITESQTTKNATNESTETSTDNVDTTSEVTTESTDLPTTVHDTTTQSVVTENEATTPIIPSTIVTECTTVQPTPVICPDGYFGSVSHPERCDAYFMCTGWDPILLFCPFGNEFDPTAGTCVVIAEGGCNWQKNSTTSETGPTTIPTSPETSTDAVTANLTTTSDFVTQNGSTTESWETTSSFESTSDAVTQNLTTTSDFVTQNGSTTESWETTSPFESTTSDFVTENGSTTESSETTTYPESNVPQTTLEATTDEIISSEPTTLNVTEAPTTQSVVTENEETTPNIQSTVETEGTTVQPTPVICPDGYFGSVPHPERCDAYFMCTGWDPILLFCPSGNEFDPAAGTCVVIAEGGCNWQKNSTTSLTEATTISTSPETSTDAVTANLTTTSDFVTQNGSTTESWDTTSSFESTDDAVTQNLTTTSDFVTQNGSSTESWDTTTYPESTVPQTTLEATTNEFITSEPTTLNETEGTTYEATTENLPTITESQTTKNATNESTETSTIIEELTTDWLSTDLPTTQPTPVICPDGYFGSVPHPERCDAYFMCTGWDPILLYCPSGNEFDPAAGTCVVIAEGGCNWQKNSTTSVTEATTDAVIQNVTTTSDFVTQNGSTTEYWDTTSPFESTTEIVTQNLTTTSDFVTQNLTTTSDFVTQNGSSTESWETTTSFESTDSAVTKNLTTTSDFVTQNGSSTESWKTTTSFESTDEQTTESRIEFTTLEPTTEANEATTPVICPDGFFGSVPNPEDCESYYMCTGWMPIPLRCPNGFEFDQNTESCVTKAEGGCTWYSTSTFQPSTEASSPQFTTAEIATDNQETTTMKPEIPTETTTDEISATVTEVTSEFTDTTETATIPVDDVFVPPNPGRPVPPPVDPEATTIEVTTDTETTVDLVSTTLGATTEKEETTTLDTSTTEQEVTEAAPICPDGFFGSVPHPDECDTYYMCSGWMPILLRCSAGFEFNPATQTCVAIADGGCTYSKASRII
ncbi:chitin binding peritrophin-A domain-containing protein [Phthorimaea operculella]|nr:chitin binding peritrophin-A domain-containing protein [Phthorimaea operculella]